MNSVNSILKIMIMKFVNTRKLIEKLDSLVSYFVFKLLLQLQFRFWHLPLWGECVHVRFLQLTH